MTQDTYLPEPNVYDMANWKPIPVKEFIQRLRHAAESRHGDLDDTQLVMRMEFVGPDERMRLVYDHYLHTDGGVVDATPVLLVLYNDQGDPLPFIRTDVNPGF